MSLKIALSGGIGSGKTLVAQLFEMFEVPVFYSDSEAKKIVSESNQLKEEIRKEFGDKVIQDDGQTDRKALAKIVFSDDEKLEKLNSLIHPKVREAFNKWVIENAHEPLLINEAALHVETGQFRKFDLLIVVTAPKEIRIQRVIIRDGTSREEVLSRMKKQLPEKEKNEKADIIITNDGSHSLIKQVAQIHQKLLSRISYT